MKWGIRRYQNKDGTLTAEGKKRYGIEEGQKTSPYESTHEHVSYDIVEDKKLSNEIRKAALKDEALMKSAKSYKDAHDKFIEAERIFGEKWSKDHKGEEWSGDGTEFHWELQKQYPEYNDIYKNEQHALRLLVENATRFSKEDHGIKGVKDLPGYFWANSYKGKEYYYKGNAFAAAVADISSDGYASTFINSHHFIEYYEKNKKGLFKRVKSSHDLYED
jgi:hypothetical protein